MALFGSDKSRLYSRAESTVKRSGIRILAGSTKLGHDRRQPHSPVANLTYTGCKRRVKGVFGLTAALKRVLRIVGGMLLLIGGLIGWILPVIPGWPLVIPGLMLLSHEFHWARRLLAWLKSKMPKQSSS